MLVERKTEGFKSDREKTSQVNHSSSKEKNTNDKVNNTPGHHYPIDDIYTKTLIAPKSFQKVFQIQHEKNPNPKSISI